MYETSTSHETNAQDNRAAQAQGEAPGYPGAPGCRAGYDAQATERRTGERPGLRPGGRR